MKTNVIKPTIVLMLISSLAFVSCKEDRTSDKDTPNMTLAYEAGGNEDYVEMARYIALELSDNPKNGYAYAQRAWLNMGYGEYGNAINDANTALKYIPIKDKEYRVFAYTTRANAYNKVEEYEKALDDYSKAIKIDPELSRSYLNRADYYYERERYDLSDQDYKKYVELEPGSPWGYLALGRNATQQKHYSEAIDYFNKAIQLRDDVSRAYAFRAESYIALGRYEEAASDIVKALDIDSDDKAFYHMLQLADSNYDIIASRLKIQQNIESNNAYWLYCLGEVSQEVKNYNKAIGYFKDAIKLDRNAALFDAVSECYYEMGDFSKALQYINIAISMDSTELDYRDRRIQINYELGNRKAVLNDADYRVHQEPNFGWYYYDRGWYKDLYGDINGAIEDFTACITLDPEYAYSYLTRGCAYLKTGNKTAAMKDFKKCIEIDTCDFKEMDCAYYAYHYLGDDKNAVRLLDTALQYDLEENLYDAVCLYSLIGNKTKALEYLRMAFESGFNRFTHIELDDDLDNIRNEESFKQMVNYYRQKNEQRRETDAVSSESFSQKTAEIPFTQRNGVQEIKCSVNGLPLYFIFDTGAGDVSISSVEAAFMLKNGFLTSKDIMGKASYQTASGDIIDGTVVMLHDIEMGGLSLKNVRASVVHGQSAPLLLGQSALSKLGKIEIDNMQNVIRIDYQTFE